MMAIDLSARIIFAGCAVILILGIIQMIRKGLIKEKHSLLWLPLGLVFMVFCIFPELLIWFSAKVHLHYITVVVLCVIVVFTLILLYFTVKLSRLREDVNRLAQEQALHAAECRNSRRQNDETPH